MMRSSRVSMFHQDVSDVIAAMQIEHQMEYLAEDGIFSVDVAVIRDDQKVAVEVDGPYHYTLNTHQPLGHTLLRSACSFQSALQPQYRCVAVAARGVLIIGLLAMELSA